jgi:hypothetical protein
LTVNAAVIRVGSITLTASSSLVITANVVHQVFRDFSVLKLYRHWRAAPRDAQYAASIEARPRIANAPTSAWYAGISTAPLTSSEPR